LGINSDALKRWACDANRGKKVPSTGAAFIPLPRTDPMPNHSECNAVVHCEFPNGLTLALSEISLLHSGQLIGDINSPHLVSS